MKETYMNVYKQNFDELMKGFIGETLKDKSLVGTTLMNCWLFVKFIRIFHRQTFVLYNIKKYI